MACNKEGTGGTEKRIEDCLLLIGKAIFVVDHLAKLDPIGRGDCGEETPLSSVLKGAAAGREV